ncbi:serine/threonine-protein kinase [Marinactinospora endophytica]
MPGSGSLLPNDPTAFGRYSVVGRLGRGGQGVVYLGRDPEGDEYAIKVLNDQWAQDGELRRRFEKEVRAAQKVASFCTAAIHEANLDDDPPYVVSEYVPGPSLQEAVAKEGPRKGAALQRLAVSTATALVAIHQAGIVHRDFKPGNVLLGPDGPRVIDFGIARVVDGTATMTNSIVGTPSYMAPEQIAGTGITDKVDIFAWGCVMAFASTGNAPFGADSVPAVVHRVVSAPPDIDGITGPLRPIIEDCLNKDPEQRPTAQKLLMRLLGHDEGDAPSPAEAMAEGARIAGSPTGGQPQPPAYTPLSHSGPQTPYPNAYRTPHGGHPATGPQQGGYAPHMSQMPPTGGHPGMGRPPMTGPSTPYPGAPIPQPNVPREPAYTGQSRSEDPVLSQGWVIPAVLITIIILLLLLVLTALAT